MTNLDALSSCEQGAGRSTKNEACSSSTVGNKVWVVAKSIVGQG